MGSEALAFRALRLFLKSNCVSAWRPSVFSLFGQRKVTKRKATPRPRPVCVVHTGSPAVLAGSRPLRNSHIPVLGHARFPLDPPPLLGAPEGPHVPSTRLPAWILSGNEAAGLRGLSVSKQAARAKATAKSEVKASIAATVCIEAEARRAELAPLLSLRSRFLSSKSIRKLASKTRQEAGSKGKWGPLWSAEERSEAQGKASMSEHMDVRVAQRPALREHRREPRVHDAPGARKLGAFFLGYFFLGKQKEVTRPPGRNAFASESSGDSNRIHETSRKASNSRSPLCRAAAHRVLVASTRGTRCARTTGLPAPSSRRDHARRPETTTP